MFDEFAGVLCFVGIAYFIYKWIEIVVLKKERLELLSRLDGEGLVEYLKRLPIGVGGGKPIAVQSDYKQPHPATWALRGGLVAVGLGVGLFFAYLIIEQNHSFGTDWVDRNAVEFLVLVGGLVGAGVGLLISFAIEYVLCKKRE